MNLLDHIERACELVFKAIMKRDTAKHSIADAWSLANSLDAWRPLWERMDALQRTNHQIALARIKTDSMYMWDFQPIHHLEAALRAIEVECPECEDISESILKALGRFHPQAHVLAVWRYEIAKDMSIAAFRKVIDKLVSEGLLTLGIVGEDNHCNVFPHLTSKGLMASITYKSTCTCNNGKITLWDKLERETTNPHA